MPYPSDPNKIIKINNIETTTGKLYEYYIKNKKNIIKECDYRRVLLFNVYDDTNQFTVVRKYKDNAIILNNDNYEEIISGYTVSISVESEYPGKILKQKLIDIDKRSPKIKEDDLKSAVYDLARFYNNYPIHVTVSSKGYHVRIDINNQPSSKVLQLTENELKDEFSGKYDINSRSRIFKDKINFDLIAMQVRGSLTVPYALNRNLTVCQYVDIKKLPRFKRRESMTYV